ncbi:MAG: hypothetical protein IJL52_03000 [Clostridia bacterium]|nr:hypothetical protein [Clostridia bacterium]
MKTTKRLVSVLLALVLAFGVLSLAASADTNYGVRTVAITEKPVYYMPDRESAIVWNTYFYDFLRIRFDADLDEIYFPEVEVYDGEEMIYRAELEYRWPVDEDGCLHVGGLRKRSFGDPAIEPDRPYKIVIDFPNRPDAYSYVFDGTPAVTFNGSAENVTVTSSGSRCLVTISLDRVVQRACTCTCHGRKAGESSFVWFFKNIFFNHIQMPLWALFKIKGHRTCSCGRIHY